MGTDHAYLPVFLLRNGRIDRAVASDVNEGPLQRGRETARNFGAEEAVTFRRCDGLEGIGPEEVDTVAICGMGGELIARILDAAPWTREVLLLLQPMSSQPELRRWLLEHGYVILTATGWQEPAPYTPPELWAGRQIPGQENPRRGGYLADQICRRERALAGMQQGETKPENLAREEALLAELKKMEREWNAWQW